MKRYFANIKIYFDRSRGYTIYVQYFMIVVVFFKSIGVKFNEWWMWPAIGGLYIAGSILIGWLDYKSGIFGEEQRRHTASNPMWQETITRLRNIETILTKKAANETERREFIDELLKAVNDKQQ